MNISKVLVFRLKLCLRTIPSYVPPQEAKSKRLSSRPPTYQRPHRDGAKCVSDSWCVVCGPQSQIEPAPNHRRTMASPCAAASITLGDAIQTISFTEVKWFVKTTWVLRQLCSINSLTKNISHRFTLSPFHINPELSGIWSERLTDF